MEPRSTERMSSARISRVAGVMSRKPLKTSFAINLLAPMARIAVALVTIPIYVRHVGDARYGVISIMWVLLGYFGFLDLGLSRAATNALAKLREASQQERARVLLTTLALNFGFGVVGATILLILGGYLLEHFISIPDALRPEVARSFPWIAVLFPLALISGVGIGALESRERFLLANVLQILGMSLTQIAPAVNGRGRQSFFDRRDPHSGDRAGFERGCRAECRLSTRRTVLGPGF